ncbi:MAG TPA: sodium-dependent transporter [Bacillota bacterium]|nr:sodium-dependent transporter [Bacillota bacterium]HQO43010.1 sodium-dependent transporter [Bacillota bacterium]HQQ44218.1 sodium-dependent transporter [Bacillota bacterium]
MTEKRENWGSRFGFLMAAAGSAVGLGNIWRFPYLTGMNGGAAFIIIYLGCVALIGLCIMTAEFAVGRRSGLAAVGAYKSVSDKWTFAGALGVLSGFFIMGFYPVVGGWAMAYIAKSFTGLLAAPEAIGDVFGAFIGAPVEPLVWMVIYLVINVLIVAKGIQSGIEAAGKVMMPLLYVLLAAIIFRTASLPGAGEGLKFLFTPDFSKVTGQTFLAALGQAFFSLSLGMGCMITYGSYLNKEEKLPANALIVTTMDTSVALLAAVAIFPALFAFGIEPTAGPGLVFIVLPQVFAQMGGVGPIFSALFFVLLFIAALTSSVSLLEVVVAYLIDQHKMARKKAVYITSAIMAVMCMLSSLSMGVMSGFKIFGVGFFDFFDILTDKIFLAVGGGLLAICVGFFMKKEDLKDELTNGGTVPFPAFELWYNLTKYVVPVIIAVIAFSGIMAIQQKSLMIFGLVIIAVLAAFSKKL